MMTCRYLQGAFIPVLLPIFSPPPKLSMCILRNCMSILAT